MKRFLLYLLFLLSSLNLTAQVVYPIRTTTVLSQPLPYSLSGFVSEPGKMTLNIFVDDVNLDQYAVKFRLHFEGNGIKISTRPTLYQEPYYLDGGMTHSLTGPELELLMDPDNLVFEGYSRQQYQKEGRLPEGAYRVWIDVIDYYRNVKVAMSMPGIAMIYLSKAPRLSFPVDKAEVDPSAMPSIRFSWFSIMPADPLADIAYRFQLYEIRPAGRDPYEVVNVMQPIFQEEIDQSHFTYDMGMPPLLPGQWYAWRVEAYDRENRVKFQNDGHSDVLTFRYGQSCKLPELRINAVENHDVTLAWQPEMNTKNYLIAYKKVKDDQWFEKGTSLSQIKIGGLDDNTGYQVKIKSLCGEEETEFSRIQEFKTPREINYACGKKEATYDLSNTDPLPVLGRFDEFKAADFIVEVEEVEGDNGYFTGKGYALVPYLGFLKFRVSFENIFVNTDGRMTSGQIEFVYDEATGVIVGEKKGEEETDEADEIKIADGLEVISDQVIVSDQEVKDVVIVDNNVVITYNDGSTQEVNVDADKKVSVLGGGDGGQAYVADPGSGKVFKTPKKVSGGGNGASSVGSAAQTGEFGCGIQFSQAKNQRYGFDRVGNGKNKPNSYFKTSKTGDKVPWKSLQSGSSDVLDLTVSGTCSPDSLRYIRNSGLLTPSIPQGKKHQLLLTGLSEGEEDILTVARAKIVATGDSTSREILTEVGALGLISYDRISRDVVLIPVNGAQCPQFEGIISKELNEIYAPAVVDWHVSIQPNLEVDAIKGQVFEHSGTGTLSKYTSHMRQVIKAYKKEHETDKQSLYLFFIEESTATKTGFMPLASEYGFIFNFRTDTHVLAHELGHGKDFNLRHTFSDKAQHFFPKKSTQNLMDYAGGSELWKYQWDLIHNPEKILFSWAQDEEEGAYEEDEYISKVFQKVRCAYVNGDDYIKEFSKKGKFSASFSDYGYFTIKLDGNAAKLGKVQNVVESRVITGRGESFSHDVIVLNYEGLVVEASKKKSNGEDTDIKGLQDYLFPENSLGIKSDFNRVISQIVEKTSLTSNDIEEIRTIANCGGQYFSTKNRYLIISKILSYSGSESYEDLILDLIENHGDDENFATEFLGYLNEDISLLKALFREMDNSTLVWGNEENFDRFLQVIFKLWLNSSYKEESKYDYYNYAFSGATKPRCFNYDGSYWFPETSYTTSFNDVNVQFNYEYSSSGVQKSGKIEYDFFQPIYIVNNVEGGLLTTKNSIPAIYLAGIIKNNNLDHSIKTLSIITDVALTFTAVGNLSKLRHLTKLKRGVKIFIGGIEFASSGLDIILNYTDICSDDEFCNSLKEYNSYLQLALVGGELIKASLKTTLKETKDKVAKEYAEKRNKLQDKFSDDEIKELDEHFGYDRLSHGSETSITRLNNFFNRFDEDLSELRKVVNKLSEADQIKFLDDFENLKNKAVIEQLKDPEGALFLGWKKFRNKYEKIGICID